MKTNRSLLVYILLSLITFGIYSIYFEYAFARDMNIVCSGDGKKTHGVIWQVFFNMLTLGIYGMFWLFGVGERIADNCYRQGIPYNKCDGGKLIAWSLLGSLIYVGPFVCMHKRIAGLNRLCENYNVRAASPQVHIHVGA